MSNNIEALMIDLKAAADKATPGQWSAFIDVASSTYSVFAKKVDDVIKWTGFDGRKNAGNNAKFIALASPKNIKALIVALEQAQQESKEQTAQIEELESQRKLAFMASNRWRDKCVEAEKRIEELESSRRGTEESLIAAVDNIAELEARQLCVKPRLAPHKYRECVNELLEQAIAYAGTQQLRERLAYSLENYIEPDHPHTRRIMEGSD